MNFKLRLFVFLNIISGLLIIYILFFQTEKGQQVIDYFFEKYKDWKSLKDNISTWRNIIDSISYDTGVKLNFTWAVVEKKKLESNNINKKIINVKTNKNNIEEKKELFINKDFIESQLPSSLMIFTGIRFKTYYNNHGFYVLKFYKNINCKELFERYLIDNLWYANLVEIDDKKIIMQNTLPGDKICFFNIKKFEEKKVFMYVFGKENNYFVITDKVLYYKLKPYFQQIFK